MDKPRSKRPPDVNEALSSMLWTPYDQSAATSSSSNDSLSDDERHKGEKKLNRYSNPLPSSLNWWNNHQNVPSPHPLTLRYSFPYYGNFLAQPSPSCYTTNDNIHHSTATATAAKRTISTTVELGNHGQAINTSTFSTTMVHSFTDDFYQYQNQATENISNCQSTNKHHKSHPILPYGAVSPSTAPSPINTHLVASTNTSKATTTAACNNTFNQQRNSVRNTNKWQSGKTGNMVEESSNVYYDDCIKKHARTGNNMPLEWEGKSIKVTQPLNIIESYGTNTMCRSKCSERRGNKQHEHDHRNTNNTHSQMKHSTMKTLCDVMATKQISHNRISNESTSLSSSDVVQLNGTNDVADNYRLFNIDHLTSSRMEQLPRVHINSSGSSCADKSPNGIASSTQNNVSRQLELHNRDLSGNFLMPSSSNVQPQTNNPVSLTNKCDSSASTANCVDIAIDSPNIILNRVSRTSNMFCNNDVDYQLKKNILHHSSDYASSSIVSCNLSSNVDVNNENNQNCMNVECCEINILMPNGDVECANRVKNFQSTDKCSTEAIANGPINADNLITSAIESYSMASTAPVTPSKTKYDIIVEPVREKRRRDRRDRRLARSRASNGIVSATSNITTSGLTNEILPDIINNNSPPPYASIPPQQVVPSIVSTVPVEDNRYTFSLPLVRRSASDRSGKDCCGQWFNGPPLRFLVVLVALGGVACTLGGATLGSIALAGSPTSHLTAGLLMTGVGIVLVTISGVAWRMTTSDAHQCTGRCGRRQCSRGNTSFGLLYPEFQHRQPPPTYQASMQEHRLRMMMLDRERQASNARASPPPTYRSNAGTLLRPPMHFQRQNPTSNTENVQVEIPIESNLSAIINERMNGITSSPATNECSQHQSPASSKTITTIASINRLDDNEFSLRVAASQNSTHETVADVTSLITSNGIGIEDCRMEHRRHEIDGNVVNHFSHETLNCSTSSRSSSRCKPHSDSTMIICNKDYVVSIMDQATTADEHCKNVNNSNTKELNKAPTLSSHQTASSRVTNQRDTIFVSINHDGGRCEMGVR